MKLLLGGGLDTALNSFLYEGIIGIAYSNIFTGFFAVLIVLIIISLAIIGLIQVIKWIGWGLPDKKKR